MKNTGKIIAIIIIVAIGSIIGIRNVNNINKGYIVSDIENKDEIYEDIKGVENNDYIESNVEENQISDSLDNITIYISGEVKSPGVVELKSDARLADGVNLCGGLTDKANLNGINLAMKIKDESHYIIPKIGDETINTTIDDRTNDINENTSEYIHENQNNNNENKININTASISELDSLPGFGEATAQKIIEYRQENEKFNSIEELMNIKGIGEKKFNDVKDYICVQ